MSLKGPKPVRADSNYYSFPKGHWYRVNGGWSYKSTPRPIMERKYVVASLARCKPTQVFSMPNKLNVLFAGNKNSIDEETGT